MVPVSFFTIIKLFPLSITRDFENTENIKLINAFYTCKKIFLFT